MDAHAARLAVEESDVSSTGRNVCEIAVRAGTPADAALVADMNRRLAIESEGRAPDAATLRAGVEAALADPRRGRYLLAEREGSVCGQLMLTYEWSDWRNGWFWWIQSVYTVPEARRQGVFRALCAEAERLARAEGDVCGLRLYVEDHNVGAQAVYAATGLSVTGYRVLERDWSGALSPAPPNEGSAASG